jgi:serine/threonine protein kinase
MWSVGIVLYAALSGTLPYDEKGSQRAEEIVSDKSNLFGNVQWERVSKDAKDLIADKLLVVQPTLRITSSVC